MKRCEWDISLLKEMRQHLLHCHDCSSEDIGLDIEQLDYLIRLYFGDIDLSIPVQSEDQFFLENIGYMITHMNLTQLSHLKSLKSVCEKSTLKIPSLRKRSFDFGNISNLFADFLLWFPPGKIKDYLKFYYREKTFTHVHCARPQKKVDVLGVTYEFSFFNTPFIYLNQTTYIETFMTFVHEMAHVAMILLGSEKCESAVDLLFSEIEGQYFELLAFQYLCDRGCVLDGRRNAICNLRSLKHRVESVQLKNLWSTSLKGEQYEKNLQEIYSYLGALELFGRYHGDYEKQLYDLMRIKNIHSDRLDNYLKKADFKWREDDFRSLKKHRVKLKQLRQW